MEFAMGSTAASSIPTPVFEISKQIVLAGADLTLCWRIYSLYYDEELNLKEIGQILGALLIHLDQPRGTGGQLNFGRLDHAGLAQSANGRAEQCLLPFGRHLLRLAARRDFHVERQGFACQRVITIKGYCLVIDF